MNFKIKVTGGGFRRKSGSVSNFKKVLTEPTSKPKTTSRSKRDLELRMRKNEQEKQIREYFSCQNEKK